jgi:hypothetical protein
MNGLFAREVYIRLSEDGSHFVCTTAYGRFYTKKAEFALDDPSAAEVVEEKSLVPLRNRLFEREHGDH